MKAIFFSFLFVLGLTAGISSRADDSDNEGMKILNEIVQGTVESTARQAVVLSVYDVLGKTLGEKAASSLGMGYSVYGLIQDTRNYQSAKTEQQRYYAGMNGVTDIITLFPVTTGVGVTMKLVLTGQSILAAYINKEEMKKIMDIYGQASRIERETLRIRLGSARREFKMLQTLWAETIAALEESKLITSFYEELCSPKSLQESFERRKSCLTNGLRISFLHGLAGRLASQMLMAPLSILKREDFIKLLGVEQEKMKLLAKSMTDLSLKERASLRPLEETVDREELAPSSPRLKDGIEKNEAAFQCLRVTREEILPFLKNLRLFDLKEPTDLAIVEVQRDGLLRKFQSQCHPILNSVEVPPRTLKFLAEIQSRLDQLARP